MRKEYLSASSFFILKACDRKLRTSMDSENEEVEGPKMCKAPGESGYDLLDYTNTHKRKKDIRLPPRPDSTATTSPQLIAQLDFRISLSAFERAFGRSQNGAPEITGGKITGKPIRLGSRTGLFLQEKSARHERLISANEWPHHHDMS